MYFRFLIISILVFPVGCSPANSSTTNDMATNDTATNDTATNDTGTKASTDADQESTQSESVWSSHVGERITITGTAINFKVGANLRTEKGSIFIDLPQTHWPSGIYHGNVKDTGETVTVTGTVVERHDLPVFVIEADRNGFPPQGIGVSEGTDLHTASKRYILEEVEWSVVK